MTEINEWKQEWTAFSPDGVPCTPEVYDTEEAANEALKEWVKRYKDQGYYSTINEGKRIKIPYDDILSHCKVTKTWDEAMRPPNINMHLIHRVLSNCDVQSASLSFMSQFDEENDDYEYENLDDGEYQMTPVGNQPTNYVIPSHFVMSKNQLIVDARDNEGSFFMVFEFLGFYFCAEQTHCGDASVYIWTSLNEMTKGVNWLNYIIAGITEHGNEILKDYMDIIKNDSDA